VTEAEPWEQVTVGGLRVTAAPARHGVPEITFVIQGAGKGRQSTAAVLARSAALSSIAEDHAELQAIPAGLGGDATSRGAAAREVASSARRSGDGQPSRKGWKACWS
jgi:hypothetical protein